MVKHVPGGGGGGGTVTFDPIEVRPDTGGGGWNPGPGREPRQDPDPGHEEPR